MLTRRTFGAAVAAIPVLGLAACGGKTESQLQADVQTIATGVSGIVDSLIAAGVVIPGADQAKIASELVLIQGQASAIAAVAVPGQKPVTDFVDAVNELGVLTAPFVAKAPQYAALMQAAVSLAQTVLLESGAISVGAERSTAMAAPQARAILRAAH